MKRVVSILLVISLLFGSWAGSGRAATASGQNQKNKDKNVIRTTIKDRSGADRQLNVDVVKNAGVTFFDFKEMSWDDSQVSDGHYYYLRQIGKKEYTIYQDAGKKVGCFKLKAESRGEFMTGMVKYQSKFYVSIHNLNNNTVKIAVVDLVNQETETMCQIPNAANDDIVFYQGEIYCFHEDDIKDINKVKKWSMTGKHLETYSLPKLAKDDFMYFSNIADRKIYYVIHRWKGKGKKRTREKVVFRCLDMKNNRNEQIFSYKPDEKVSGIHGIYFLMKGKEIYCVEQVYWKEEPAMLVYYLSTKSGKMETIGNGTIMDFAYTDRYYFYIDTKHRLHRQDRDTKKDQVISEMKAAHIYCTSKGLYVQKYDSLSADADAWEYLKDDYSRALYYMSFDGKKVKLIEKRKLGHIDDI